MNFAEAVDNAMPIVNRVREVVFPKICAAFVHAVHDQTNPEDQGAHFIEFGAYVITPIEGRKPTLKGPIPCLQWNLMTHSCNVGSYSEPPDVEEIDKGDFDSVEDCLAQIGKDEIIAQISGVCDYIYREKEANEAVEYVEEDPPESQLCPHGEHYHECNTCMTASDFAYDAMREDRRFGR